MTEPISARNLDRYGSAELPWSRSRDILAKLQLADRTQAAVLAWREGVVRRGD